MQIVRPIAGHIQPLRREYDTGSGNAARSGLGIR